MKITEVIYNIGKDWLTGEIVSSSSLYHGNDFIININSILKLYEKKVPWFTVEKKTIKTWRGKSKEINVYETKTNKELLCVEFINGKTVYVTDESYSRIKERLS